MPHKNQGKAPISMVPKYTRLLRINKHNIGIEEAPKMVIIGDYWDQETIMQVVELIKEKKDMFPHNFFRIWRELQYP